MKLTLYSQTQALGSFDLKIMDQSMGVIGGILVPTKEYLALQPIFRKSSGAYNQDIKALQLNVQLENGCFLHPAGGYSILDAEDFPDEISVEIVGSNYFHFFDTSDRGFVEDPWFPLTIASKLSLENELMKEISLFRRDKRFRDHTFAQNEFYALAQHGPNDDVLFYMAGKNECQFAVIHLTWKGYKEENPAFPLVRFYEQFEDFKQKEMHT